MSLSIILLVSAIIIVALLYVRSKKLNPTKTNTKNMGNEWTISTYYENNFPVIMKLIKEVPDESTVKRLPYLTVISWKYDGSNSNGMPEQRVNNKMITFEDAIGTAMENSNNFTSVYTRTGNNIKEFVYYCTNQNEFMNLLNQALRNHEAYPIEINFYEDKAWIDCKKILHDFNKQKRCLASADYKQLPYILGQDLEVVSRTVNNAIDNNYLGRDRHGVECFAKIAKDGKQIYAYAQDGIVKGAGWNTIPKNLVKAKNLIK